MTAMNKEPKLPPIPKGGKIKHAMSLGIDIWNNVDRFQEEYGDSFTLTLPGRRLVENVTRRRRTAIQRILRRMPATERDALASALAAFADAAGETDDEASILTLLWPATS